MLRLQTFYPPHVASQLANAGYTLKPEGNFFLIEAYPKERIDVLEAQGCGNIDKPAPAQSELSDWLSKRFNRIL